jgi:hypothetical protein
MFYQNSNDLVKQASVNSGHIQNSYATQQQLINKGQNVDANNGVVSTATATGTDTATGTLSIGSTFQNVMNNLIGSVTSTMEGLSNDTSASGSASGSASQPVSGSTTQILNTLVQQDAAYIEQQEKYRKKISEVNNLITTNDNSRKRWLHVIDIEGVSKYGYMTNDRIFQIWLAPAAPTNNPQNWFETSPIKQNGGVLGCPVTGGSLTKYEIGVKWSDIKPFDMVYGKNDTSRNTPLFMLTNVGVRDVQRTVGSSGLFSCDNERKNVFVKERPSADFDISNKTNRQGCYIVNENARPSTFTERGFIFQNDLTNVSISQCKRRAEDLGSSYFLVSAPNSGQPADRGGCWIYTGSGEPNLNGLLSYDDSGKKCYNHGQADGNEDGFMKSYGPTILPRFYGKTNTIDVSTDPPNPTCNHRTRNGCIFKDYIHYGNAVCYPSNRNGAWAYGGLFNYNNNDLKGWLGALYNRNADGLERPAVQEYIERCKNTQGYEFLNDNPVKRTKEQKSVALYSLKTGGPTGVDVIDRNGRGMVGRIAYIDHNGEKHDYPESALSYMKSGDSDASGSVRYVDVGPYDTRSAENSYTLKSINASLKKCQEMCDDEEKCGGLVYTTNGGGGGGGGGEGKCELKDKTKMYPVGLRTLDYSKKLMLKVPSINATIKDSKCAKLGNGEYQMIDSAQYQYYPDGGAMTSGTKCDLLSMVPQEGTVTMPNVDPALQAVDLQSRTLNQQIINYGDQTKVDAPLEGFIGIREGLETDDDAKQSEYGKSISGVGDTLKKIGNAQYQRERLDAIKDESNKLLISESYKFILWSILAILAVMALLKLKEMFGQDDQDEGGGDGDGGGGILGFITSLFGIGAVKMDDIADRTGDMKAALSDAGATLQQSSENLANGITQGADNLVTSVNDAAASAVDGARNMVDQVGETATNAVNSIGETASGVIGGEGSAAKTGGRRRK